MDAKAVLLAMMCGWISLTLLGGSVLFAYMAVGFWEAARS